MGQPVGEAPSETRLRSLFGHLREAPECRSARGIRHSLASVLAVTVVAKLAGYRGVTAISEFAARLDQKQLRAVRAFLSPTSGRRYPPSRSSLHRILSDPDPEVLERAVRDWVAQTGGLDCALALDGKSAHRTAGESDRCLVAAVEHGAGVVRGQVSASGFAGSETVAARQLIDELNVAGRRLTLDALHSCRKTAALIVAKQADYVLVVKGNQPTVLEDLQALQWDGASGRETVDKGHRRLEKRVCDVLAPGDNYEGFVALPGRRQAFRIVCERTVLKTGKTTTETVYGNDIRRHFAEFGHGRTE